MEEERHIYRPFIRWAGGKRYLIKYIQQFIPKECNRYFEPFLGSGAIFFYLSPKKATLSDNNSELINCYLQVKNHPRAILNRLHKLKNQERIYYRVRSSTPQNEIEKAARFIYLNACSYNGIYRQNLHGVYNVPFGDKEGRAPWNEEAILRARKALKGVEILCGDFSIIEKRARKNDFIYLDPPYTVAHGNNGFIKYNAKIFTWTDQMRLRDMALQLSKRGCFVLISNADHPSIHKLYKRFNIVVIERSSVIAADTKKRKTVTECIISR